MASGSFRDAKLERPVSGAELRRLLVASRPTPAVELMGKLSSNVDSLPAPAARRLSERRYVPGVGLKYWLASLVTSRERSEVLYQQLRYIFAMRGPFRSFGEANGFGCGARKEGR